MGPIDGAPNFPGLHAELHSCLWLKDWAWQLRLWGFGVVPLGLYCAFLGGPLKEPFLGTWGYMRAKMEH